MTIPSSLHRYFWNCRVEELDTEQHKYAIIETLLERSDLEAWRWMVKTYTEEDIIPVLRRSCLLTPPSRSFWSLFFHIDLPERPQDKNWNSRKWREQTFGTWEDHRRGIWPSEVIPPVHLKD